MPRITRSLVYGAVREMLPGDQFGPAELWQWIEDMQRVRQAVQTPYQAPSRPSRLFPHPSLNRSYN